MPETQIAPRLRVVVFRPGGEAAEREFAQSEIHVGRLDPRGGNGPPDLDLASDLQVSRAHARLCWVQGKWWIEDLGSRRGTLLEGQEIRGRGPVELLPGVPVKTGKTVWMVVPTGNLFVHRDGIVVHGPCANALNYATFHCGVPFLGALTARNIAEAPSEGLSVGLRLVDFSEHCHVEVPPLGPGDSATLRAPALRLRVDQLRRVTEPVRTRLRVEVNGKPDVAAERDVLVLGSRDWAYEPAARKMIAAFVSPRNPVVERVVAEARGDLPRLAAMESFDQVLRSGREDAERLVLAALYGTLLGHYRVRWLPQELGRAAGFGETYQTVRPPHRMFLSATSREAHGTCLDLTVFLAACLESIGVCPVVVFTGALKDCPRHAFGGCWVGAAPGDRPVVCDAPWVRRQVDAGNLLVVEWTGLAEGAGERCDFDRATARAAEQVAATPWLCVVDIKVLRPPTGSITPLDTPLEPEVDRAYAEAEQFATLKKRSAIETTHLLYGLLAARGPTITRLCARAGLDPDVVRQRVHDSFTLGQCTNPPIPTRNYHECRRYAEDLAWHAGVHAVREQEVLWALLVKGRESGKFRDKCKAAGVELDQLGRLLAEDHPCPRIEPYRSSTFSVLR